MPESEYARSVSAVEVAAFGEEGGMDLMGWWNAVLRMRLGGKGILGGGGVSNMIVKCL
tara:strand:- start:88 stop:261 length:174 start_codon:yes stop_codon:yes gene_type:complete